MLLLLLLLVSWKYIIARNLLLLDRSTWNYKQIIINE